VKLLIQQGKIECALKQCKQYCFEQPHDVQAWYILTDLYLRVKHITQALNSVLKAESLEPEQPQIQILKIQCLLLNGHNAQALCSANALLSTLPNLLAKDWLSLGMHFHQLNSLLSAHHCFENSVKLEPNNSQYQFNYATSLRNTGKLSEAEQAFNQVITLNPRDWDAYLARSLLKKVQLDDNNITALNSLTTIDKNKEAQSKLLFAISKEHEDCGNFDESFKKLKQANDLRHQFTQYDVNKDIEILREIATTFNSIMAPRSCLTKTDKQKQAIFIIGLPRTGTTLLERILSQPKDVLAAGELNDFASCLTQLVTANAKQTVTSTSDFIKQAARIDFAQLGQDYLNNTEELTKNSSVFIDKMPMNFLYTGLIQQALPNAKIIHLTRSPMAACYAIYKTSFGQAYPFSYNLNDLAKYYIAYRQLMKHWQQSNPNNFIEINYEELVTSPAKVSKQTFDFAGLDWHEEYLQLENNKQASATASSSQIRGGIYQSSVELWRNYHNELAPLRQALEQANIDPDTW
jgi:tetratricopeptide (TPR) repeat protein